MVLMMITDNNNNNNNNNNEFLYRIETHQCVTLLSLGSCMMMNILLMTSSFDGFQSEGPLNIEPIMV